MITPTENITIEAFTNLAKKHGLEKSLRIAEIAQVMADSVQEKYGQCEEILPAIDLLHQLVQKSRESEEVLTPKNAGSN